MVSSSFIYAMQALAESSDKENVSSIRESLSLQAR